MNALLAFLLSVGASLLSFTLIMVWYIVPRLSSSGSCCVLRHPHRQGEKAQFCRTRKILFLKGDVESHRP